jgi:transposase
VVDSQELGFFFTVKELKSYDLFSQQVDLIMFDTTTIKYWGEGKEAEILQHGYSKDKRGDLKQLIVGVLMNKDGYPVGVELIRGNTPDVKSFIEAVRKLKTRYNIGKIVWVCDPGDGLEEESPRA